MTSYTSASYASRYGPEKSIYPDDGRVFHRAGYRYCVVEGLEEGAFSGGVFTARARLSGGLSARLRVEACAERAFRIRLTAADAPTPPATSEMLAPLPPPPPLAFTDEGGSFALTLNGYTLRLGISPFTCALADPSGALIFELETEQVAGDFITPPLGLRVDERTGQRACEAGAFFSWRMRNDERFFGLGEKWNKVEKTSTRATIWSADTCGTNTTDMSYKALPVVHSTRGWGLMLHSSFRSFWEVGTFSYTAGSALVEEPRLDLFLYGAPSLKGLTERYTFLTGRPSFPPHWAFGVWMSRCAYQDRAQVTEVIDRLDREAFPCDVVHLDSWLKNHYYVPLGVDACDFDWSEERWPDHAGMLKEWRDRGVHTSLWINPYLPEQHPIYAEANAQGYLVQSERGGLARLEHGQPVGIVDLTNPAARAWWKEKLKGLIQLGGAVVKPDYGDRVPEDALFFDGRTGREMHNLYLHLYIETAFEAVKEAGGTGVVWRRAGYLGSQRCPGTWAGDTQVSWQGLRGALRGGLSASFTGEAFWSHDMGGFVGPKPSPELYIRWVQFGMLSPFARFHGTTPREPWEYGDEALRIVREWARLRYALAPYLFAAGREAVTGGTPILRHMAFEFPNEPNADTLDDQYMLGPDLLVAPVINEGQRERWVYFPAGAWTALDDPERRVTGGRFVCVPAPIERMPVYVRAGAALPRYAPGRARMGSPAPHEILLDLYPGGEGRRLVIPENGRTLELAWDGLSSLTVLPCPVTVRARVIGSGVAAQFNAAQGAEIKF